MVPSSFLQYGHKYPSFLQEYCTSAGSDLHPLLLDCLASRLVALALFILAPCLAVKPLKSIFPLPPRNPVKALPRNLLQLFPLHLLPMQHRQYQPRQGKRKSRSLKLRQLHLRSMRLCNASSAPSRSRSGVWGFADIGPASGLEGLAATSWIQLLGSPNFIQRDRS